MKILLKDNTTQSNVIVEYNATTQKYLIGPFTIQYTEKYTSDWTLASMAGDPALIVNKMVEEKQLREVVENGTFTI